MHNRNSIRIALEIQVSAFEHGPGKAFAWPTAPAQNFNKVSKFPDFFIIVVDI